jgi:hypothetical protein
MVEKFRPRRRGQARHMWWEYIIIVGVLILGGWGFLTFVRFQTRMLSRKSDRSVESIYRNYADDKPPKSAPPSPRA